jgi:hypothetical protein
VNANGQFIGNDDPVCQDSLRTERLTGFVNPNTAGDFGAAASNIAPTRAQQTAFDALAGTDRVQPTSFLGR